MEILKTRTQAKAEKDRYLKALSDMKKCPECGATPRTSKVIINVGNLGEHKKVFQRYCRKCGCVWQSDPFEEGDNW